jgi:hypothetical protein
MIDSNDNTRTTKTIVVVEHLEIADGSTPDTSLTGPARLALHNWAREA